MRLVLYSPFDTGLPHNSVNPPAAKLVTSYWAGNHYEVIQIDPGLQLLEDSYTEPGIEEILAKWEEEHGLMVLPYDTAKHGPDILLKNLHPSKAAAIVKRMLIAEDIQKVMEGCTHKTVTDAAGKRLKQLTEFNRKPAKV